MPFVVVGQTTRKIQRVLEKTQEVLLNHWKRDANNLHAFGVRHLLQKAISGFHLHQAAFGIGSEVFDPFKAILVFSRYWDRSSCPKIKEILVTGRIPYIHILQISWKGLRFHQDYFLSIQKKGNEIGFIFCFSEKV